MTDKQILLKFIRLFMSRNTPPDPPNQGWLFAMAKSIFAGTVEKTGKNRQKLENAVYDTGIRSSTLPGSSKRLNLLNLNLQL
jgi:hypothetical protein